MRVEHLHSAVAVILHDVESLDSITVILRDISPGVVHIVISCFGEAWSCQWGATGRRKAKEMLTTCSVDYLLGCFWPKHEERTESRERYLERILEAVMTAAQSEGKQCLLQTLIKLC